MSRIGNFLKNFNESKDLSVADSHQLKIAIDTIKNSNKALLGGMTVIEAEKLLKEKFGYSEEEVNKIKG
jgi:hypothetical protein